MWCSLLFPSKTGISNEFVVVMARYDTQYLHINCHQVWETEFGSCSIPLTSTAADTMLRCGATRLLVLAVGMFLLVTAYVYTGSVHYDNLPRSRTRESHRDSQDSKMPPKQEPSHVNTSHGYVLTLQYTGQQIAGVRGILSQQSWIGAFNLPLKIVEPFMVDSYLTHSASLWRTQASQKFSDFYDITFYNQQSRKHKQPQLVDWNTFLSTTPHRIILLNIENIFERECLSYSSAKACKHTKDIKPSSQFTSGCETSSNVREGIEYFKDRGFDVVREVCLNCVSGRPPFKPKDIVRYIFGKRKPSEVLLVINRWKFSIQMSPHCKPTALISSQLTRLQPGPKVLADAKQYIHTTQGNGKSSTVVAIMVRIEWFLIMYKDRSLATVKDCLSKVVNKLKELAKPHKPVLALDIGRFGSSTFSTTLSKQGFNSEYFEEITSEIKRFVKQVHNNELGFEEWEQTYLDVVGNSEDRGYVATLQSTIASEADCLIQMGGGHYQQLAWTQYLGNHPDKKMQCMYQICTPRVFEKQA